MVFFITQTKISLVIKGYQLKKLLEVVRIFEVLQTTLSENQTCSF